MRFSVVLTSCSACLRTDREGVDAASGILSPRIPEILPCFRYGKVDLVDRPASFEEAFRSPERHLFGGFSVAFLRLFGSAPFSHRLTGAVLRQSFLWASSSILPPAPFSIVSCFS